MWGDRAELDIETELRDREIDGVRLIRTCYACPELYEAMLGDEHVGYIRLRHGDFRVDCPDCGDETVFKGNPRGDGLFEDDERDHWLGLAVAEIKKWIDRNPDRQKKPWSP